MDGGSADIAGANISRPMDGGSADIAGANISRPMNRGSAENAGSNFMPTAMATIVPTILLHFLHPWRSDVEVQILHMSMAED